MSFRIATPALRIVAAVTLALFTSVAYFLLIMVLTASHVLRFYPSRFAVFGVPMLIAPVVFVALFWRFTPTRTKNQPICSTCGYNLHGLTEPRCPECGTPFERE